MEERVTARTAMELTLFRGNGVARRSPFLSSRGIVLYKTHVSRVEEAAEGHVPPIQGKALDRKLGGEDGSVTSLLLFCFWIYLFFFWNTEQVWIFWISKCMYIYIYLKVDYLIFRIRVIFFTNFIHFCSLHHLFSPSHRSSPRGGNWTGKSI